VEQLFLFSVKLEQLKKRTVEKAEATKAPKSKE
jgi:hypothetical protein